MRKVELLPTREYEAGYGPEYTEALCVRRVLYKARIYIANTTFIPFTTVIMVRTILCFDTWSGLS